MLMTGSVMELNQKRRENDSGEELIPQVTHSIVHCGSGSFDFLQVKVSFYFIFFFVCSSCRCGVKSMTNESMLFLAEKNR